MRVLVTGGAGFIGSHSVRCLLEAGHQVRVLDNFTTGKPENLHEVAGRFELVEGDLRDSVLLQRVVEGIEAILHLAAVVSVPQSITETSYCHAVNATGTLELLEAARQAGVRRFVHASSAAVYGALEVLPADEQARLDPLSPYGSQKRYNEETALLAHRLHGIETVSLRYFNVFGPRQDPRSPYSGVLSIFIDRLAGDRPVQIHGDGQQSRDFVFVGDVARANLAALESPTGLGGVYNVGTGRSTTVRQAFEAIAQAMGRPAEPTFGPERTGDIRHSLAKVSAIRQALGWQAETPFETGIARTVAWHGAAVEA